MEYLMDIWNFQLFSADGFPFTVGKIISAILLLVLSFIFAKVTARALDRRLLSHLTDQPALRTFLRKLFYYVILVIAILFTLRLLNIPVTIFTVLGGALAVGIGFGSQNIMSNFISGLILIIEQPVRLGDFVEFEGVRGTLEVMGTRSSWIRTPENKRLIVPNSLFIEKPVLNWTLPDDVVRAHVSVGVAYGSPAAKVKALLFESVTGNPEILSDPPPRVVFRDFGDSALLFDLYFWLHMNGPRLTSDTESDVRFRIDEIFRREGVSIPFPQRDVHIDVTRPLPVEWVAKS